MSFNSLNLNLFVPLANLLALQNTQKLQHHDNSEESSKDEGFKLCLNSKKIAKKRTKYNKISDEMRLKLIEAVEKDGEVLKAAAKRFKVNYSSAKSIFQTYRKEGRVLRKAGKCRRTSPIQKPEDDNNIEIPAFQIQKYPQNGTLFTNPAGNAVNPGTTPKVQESYQPQQIFAPLFSIQDKTALVENLSANFHYHDNNVNYLRLLPTNILPTTQHELKKEVSIPPFKPPITSTSLKIPLLQQQNTTNVNHILCSFKESFEDPEIQYRQGLKLALDSLMRKLVTINPL